MIHTLLLFSPFLYFDDILAFISISPSVVIIMSVLFCGCNFTMCTTSVSRWLRDKKELD